MSGNLRSPLNLESSFLWISDIILLLKFSRIPLFSALREIFSEFADVIKSSNRFLFSESRE